MTYLKTPDPADARVRAHRRVRAAGAHDLRGAGLDGGGELMTCTNDQ